MQKTVEAEQELAASVEQRRRLERDIMESRDQRAAGAGALRELRRARYVALAKGLLQPARSVPAIVVAAAAIALGFGLGSRAPDMPSGDVSGPLLLKLDASLSEGAQPRRVGDTD